MSTPSRLKHLRQHLNLNQDDFAKKTGIAQGNISSIERGSREFGKRLQEHIISTFNVSPVWWETGEGEIFAHTRKIAIYSWANLEGAVLGYAEFPFFSDCDKICEYTGKDFGDIKKGSAIAIRATHQNKVTKGDILIVSVTEGSFIGRLHNHDNKYIILENENGHTFELDLVSSTRIYRVVGVANRYI